MRYNHKNIESKWQKHWLEKKTFKCEVDHTKPKYYVLDMFPYPSGSGLHVGHVEGYTATDIVARYKRQCGYNVLHPMGWDSFGLPAEQYAIRTGTHPAVTTHSNIDNFRRQLMSLGYSYDWDREFATSDPKYYKWTQWIFTKLYEKGLAYEAEMMVNYCPALGTVLANEEVENGQAKEGGHLVERRPLRQWVLKITAYADRLLKDLDLLDWPEGLKKLQVNWIGRSEGAKIHFNVKESKEKLTVFTTRPDTLQGATFLVIAPEHPLAEILTTPAQKEVVSKYRKEAVNKRDLDRTELNKDKSGVFTGSYVINPMNGKEIPIWIADYVLMGYGTGAVMGVPAHDQRDFDFAKQYGLPVIPIFNPTIEQHPDLVPKGMDSEQLRSKVLAGEHCWEGEGAYVVYEDSKGPALEGATSAEVIEKIIQWLEQSNEGERTVTYKLRDWLFSRQRYWGEPFPILHFEDGTKRTLDLDELPLLPPDIADFKPAGDGQSPLAKVKNWIEVTDPKTGKKVRRESNTMPQWAGSCWYYLRFCDPDNSLKAWDEMKESYWMPVDLYVGGVEHAVLHLLYARFWHKVLYDCGLVSTLEPFRSLRNQGLIVARSFQNSSNNYIDPLNVKEKDGQYFDKTTGELLRSQIEKMSKSKLNGITPDDIVDEYGADALRLYEMFMGPLEKEKVWNTDSVSGCRRFLTRFHDMCMSEKVSDADSIEAMKLGHRLVNQVTKDLDQLQFNTAIAKMMEFINAMGQLPTYPKAVLKMAIQCLMPFAPHLAEEMWEHLGFTESLSYSLFPEIDQKLLQDDTVTYVVQVNGKLRGRFELPKDQPQDIVVGAAMEEAGIVRHLDGKGVGKVIFVPNKLLNFVTN